MNTATYELEDELFKSVSSKTPEHVKELDLLDMKRCEGFTFLLKKEHLEPYDEVKNPNGLGLKEWLKNYAKEAKVSTAGIRGPQNVLYPQDTRFPINIFGITLATLAKSLVALEKYPNQKIVKIAGREVRYNSEDFLEAISRIQAANGITTLVPYNKGTIPIWMASFLAFKLDLLGGEYITSSHGISVKNATKDLNSQGSQYLPEESMEFVNKIQEIFDETERNGYYAIDFSPADAPEINEYVMRFLNDGINLYIDYLKSGVAQDFSLNLIKNFNQKLVIDNVGGSAYRTLSRVLDGLGISSKFDWLHIKEDPFFHGIGKYNKTPKGADEFYDYSVDATVNIIKPDGSKFYPVIESVDYHKLLASYPDGTVLLITDPDHDRLTVVQKENINKVPVLKENGIDWVKLDDNTILAVYSANQAFLMIMDFWAKQLKKQKMWANHPRFIIKTTASAKSWDEWAIHNGVKVVNVPVGFKEIANIMKKVELQIKNNPDKDVVIDDVFGNSINLGVQPRLLFGGEESGGMIMGCEDLIKSQNGRSAIAMREKSATEAIIVASALVADLGGSSLSEHFARVLDENKIIACFDNRVDIAYYNESEPDIEKLKKDKLLGEEKRTLNDIFYLSMAIGMRKGEVTLAQIKEILGDNFKNLDFSNLLAVKFVGDGTYFDFTDKYIEIRPSGTDAKTKAYGGGSDLRNIEQFAQVMGNYSGVRTELHKKYIPEDIYRNSKDLAMNYYLSFVNKDANNEKFVLPDYTNLLNLR